MRKKATSCRSQARAAAVRERRSKSIAVCARCELDVDCQQVCVPKKYFHKSFLRFVPRYSWSPRRRGGVALREQRPLQGKGSPVMLLRRVLRSAGLRRFVRGMPARLPARSWAAQSPSLCIPRLHHPHTGRSSFARATTARAAPVGARQFSQLPVVVARQGQEAVSQEECDQFASFDGGFEKYQLAPTDPLDKSDRAFVYGINGGAKVIAGSMARLAVMKIIASLSASADVLAMSATEVDISSIKPGENVTVKFRGKPVFVRRRTQDEIDQANAVDVSGLRDPETDAVRVKNPEWLIVLAVCTHLGCVPIPNAGSFGGYFCPCHGSHYDISGRIRKGPAPLNLEVPEYEFVDGTKLVIG